MIRVLVVDDDPLVRSGLKFILGSTDDILIVGEAGDGARALEMWRGLAPDVVLMDLRMPGLDGRACTAQLTADPEAPPVLVLTTFDISEEVFAALDAGASGFLVKEAPPEELIDAVRQTADGKSVLSPEHTRMLLDRYVKVASRPRRGEAEARLRELTERELDVVAGIARGLSNAEIADELHCSPATVKAHLAHIFTRLDIPNRVALAILAHDAGLTGIETDNPD